MSDDPWNRAWAARDAGRLDEALEILAAAAEAGDPDTAKLLGDWLTEGPDRRDEGRRWLERAADGGHDGAAWNLAMDYRLDGDRDGYLVWMRRAAGLAHEEAAAILSHIDRLRVQGLPWPMYTTLEVDRDLVGQVIDGYRHGEMDAAALNRWAIEAHERRSAIRLAAPAAPLARVLAELAAGEIGLERADELIFRLRSELPDVD